MTDKLVAGIWPPGGHYIGRGTPSPFSADYLDGIRGGGGGEGACLSKRQHRSPRSPMVADPQISLVACVHNS